LIKYVEKLSTREWWMMKVRVRGEAVDEKPKQNFESSLSARSSKAAFKLFAVQI
jgi:hypothetical protein